MYFYYCVAAIDSVTNKHLDNVAKTMFPSWQETERYNYDLYYVLSDAEKMRLLRYVCSYMIFVVSYICTVQVWHGKIYMQFCHVRVNA